MSCMKLDEIDEKELKIKAKGGRRDFKVEEEGDDGKISSQPSKISPLTVDQSP